MSFALMHTDSPLEKAEEMLADHEIARTGIDELRQIQELLTHMGIDRDKTALDLTIVRGLGYYTGPVFETTLLDLPEYGSMFSGGRYDNLVDRFVGRSIPAVGTSLGVDRLLAALFELKAIESSVGDFKGAGDSHGSRTITRISGNCARSSGGRNSV